VIFEVAFLIVSIRKSLQEMLNVAERQAKLEALNENIEATVSERTAALRRSEEQLRQSQKMEAVGRLAGGVAHDFNNLLTVITGYCGLLSARKIEEPVRKQIQEIGQAAERASSLTGQLLAFSRKQVLQPRVLGLNEVVRGMEKMLRRLIGEDIELSTVFESSLRSVQADPGQIEQVILNMAVNARDAMPRGGKLTIRTSNVTIDQATSFRQRVLPVGEYVMLAISDNGVGMTEEVKAHLFEPFFTTKGVGKGTGLGLATCYGIITQSGGDIRVYSEPNSGTTFKIYLPQTDAKPDGATGADLDLPGGTEALLVVEDDSAVRRLAATVLRERGYQVQESENAVEALELIEGRPRFDLVITDVIMPQMSGKALHDEIKRRIPETKILLMSGYTDDALAQHGILDDGLAFLEKPFSPARLARKVREVLAGGGVAHPSFRLSKARKSATAHTSD
jgi:signal transduction histidine kinase/ActR/RegA family two-component response regulator